MVAFTKSVDRNSKNHDSLQYPLNEMGKIRDAYHFIHSGRLTCGKWGACKISEFKEFMKKTASFLLKKDKVDLGTLHNDRLLCVNDLEMVGFIENLLTYALIRDEYRDIIETRKRNL